MKKVGWPMLYIFLLKPFKQWSFEKFSFFFSSSISTKKWLFFNGSNSKLNLQAGREVKALNFYQYLLRECVRNPALSSKFLKTSLSRLVKQLNVENFKVVHEESRLTNVIHFFIGTIQAMKFWKNSGCFFWLSFFYKKLSFFQWNRFKIRFSLIF